MARCRLYALREHHSIIPTKMPVFGCLLGNRAVVPRLRFGHRRKLQDRQALHARTFRHFARSKPRKEFDIVASNERCNFFRVQVELGSIPRVQTPEDNVCRHFALFTRDSRPPVTRAFKFDAGYCSLSSVVI